MSKRKRPRRRSRAQWDRMRETRDAVTCGMRPDPRQLERRAVLLALAVFIAFHLVAALRFPLHGVWHDDGLYLQLGGSLAEGSYRLEQLPGSPLQGRYPPGYPTLLAGPALLGIDWVRHPGLYCIPGILLAAIGFALWYRLLRRRRPVGEAAAAAVIAGFAPATSAVLICTMSESVLFLVLPATLLILDARPTRRGIVGAGLLAAVGVLSRIAFVPLHLAIAATVGRGRRPGRVLLFFAPGALALTAWGLWSTSLPDSPCTHLRYYLGYRDVLSFDLVGNLPQRVECIGFGSLGQLLGAAYLPEIDSVLGEAGAFLRDRLLGLLAVLAAAALLVRRKAMGAAARAALAGSLVLALLSDWPTWRYLLPVMPLMVLGIIDLLRLLVGQRAVPVVATVAALGLLPCAALHLQLRVERESRLLTTTYRGDELEAMAAWICEHTAEDAVIASDYDPYFFRVTGRKAVMLAPPEPRLPRDRAAWWSWARDALPTLLRDYRCLGVSYVLTNPDLEGHLIPVVDCLVETGRAEVVYRGRPGFAILRLTDPERDASAIRHPASDALERSWTPFAASPHPRRLQGHPARPLSHGPRRPSPGDWPRRENR